MYVDLRINGLTFRMVSVYMPHAGYPTEDLMQTYDSLHCVLEGARKRNIAYVVGGDFNTQLHVGPRGDLLMQTAHMFSMVIANAEQEHDSWTFCSSMGVRRRLDFVLCSTGFDVTHGGATDLLDLGSDHRAVRAALEVTGPRSLQGRKPVARKQRWSPSVAEKRRYQINLDTCLQQSALVNMYELESCVARCAKLASQQTAQRDLADVKPWQRQDFQDLLAQRRQCRDREGRARLSKQIRAHLRRHMRDRRNRRVNDILSEFRCLNRIEDVYHNPCKAVKNTREGPSPHEFTKYLEDIFTPDRMEMQDPHVGSHDVVPPFHLHELKQAIKNLRHGKAADCDGLVLEMFSFASDNLLTCLLGLYNKVLSTGYVEQSWKNTVFTMLPKAGDKSLVQNWRPIAVLKITYKIFSKLLLGRLAPLMEPTLSPDQMGFRPCTGVEHALVVLDSMLGKCAEWGCALWCASLDLRKAFDRVNHESLFAALDAAGMPGAYVSLLRSLYTSQTGAVRDGRPFHIRRGVKQGDVLSPLLFNVALEYALDKWKQRLSHHGWDVGTAVRLTNIRFADDLLLYAKSCSELTTMITFLKQELCKIGLELNADKTKIFTTLSLELPMYIEVDDDLLEVLFEGKTHKYLGRSLSGNVTKRAAVEVAHRSQVAWGKFMKHKHVLQNKHIAVRNRLKYFDAVITPTVLFSLHALPLTQKQLHDLNILQRRMLRSIVGWRRVDGEPWSDTMTRMNQRVASALQQHPVTAWDQQLLSRQYNFAATVTRSQWPSLVCKWDPRTRWSANTTTRPTRIVGRPRAKWDDRLSKFAAQCFPNYVSWIDAACDVERWKLKKAEYIEMFKVEM
ncbi:unnamed protein product [Symbiodinium natans]|uniref:Reverse transcriptase domain-containing protein n=1 Tax=Symbiodinium natans TaxID=878477 RepID=A0A812U720_9DINO|nr:unnamed protein product [Symbiodinium natans]